MKRFYEKGALNETWVRQYCRGNWLDCVRYAMEERGEPHADWMLPDGSVDERLQGY
jgi:DNA polymerase